MRSKMKISKKKKEEIKFLKTLLFLIVFFGLIGLFLTFISPVIIMSYKSTVLSCKIDTGINLTEGESVQIAAITYTTNETTEIIYFVCPDERILKHEYVHYVQQINNRGFNCNQPFGMVLKFITEIEAYTMEKLPDRIFIFLYGEYK